MKTEKKVKAHTREAATDNSFQINRRRSDQALRQILALIYQGHLSPGKRLPPERELSELLGISRSSLREALNSLESMGYVDRRSKRGNYVCTAIPHSVREPIEEIVYSNIVSFSQIIEIRKILEIWAVAKAAESPEEDSLDSLDECLTTMGANSNLASDTEFRLYSEADQRFHQIIAEMTKNPLYIHLFHFLLSLISRSISVSKALDPGNFGEENLRMHERILKAIRSQDLQKAKEAMLMHFQFVERNLDGRNLSS